MSPLENLESGSISISDDVVAVISALAASKVKGISSMSAGIAEDFARRVSGRNTSKGVIVEVDEQVAKIDLRIIVDYGIVINEVCEELQREVKNSVESMTGLQVAEVNVKVEGVEVKPVAPAQ